MEISIEPKIFNILVSEQTIVKKFINYVHSYLCEVAIILLSKINQKPISGFQLGWVLEKSDQSRGCYFFQWPLIAPQLHIDKKCIWFNELSNTIPNQKTLYFAPWEWTKGGSTNCFNNFSVVYDNEFTTIHSCIFSPSTDQRRYWTGDLLS